MAELNRKDYHKLDAPLRDILSRIKLKDDERKTANEDLKEIIEKKVIPAMMEADEFFKRIYKRLMPSGSYYENLKISKPNEFDLNVELAIPGVEVLSSQVYGFVQVKYNGDEKHFAECEQGQKKLKKWLDSDGMIKRNEVLQWMQSVMARALPKIPIDNVEIFPSRHGPAITLKVVKTFPGKGIEFCVDLVPVLSFDEAHWPEPPVRQPIIRSPEVPVTWYIVPKEPADNPEEKTYWRISFYDQERRLMNGYDAMKAIIKLIKKLRDCQEWDFLSSYYIKTVFLWEMEEEKEEEKYSKEFWQKSIGVLFIHMLKRFVAYIKHEQCIPFFWDARHNLIAKLTSDTLTNFGNRIKNIVDKIEKKLPGDPDHVKIYFPGWNTEDSSSFSEETEYDSDIERLAFEDPFSSSEETERDTQILNTSSLEGTVTALAIGIGIVALGVTAVVRAFQENNRQ